MNYKKLIIGLILICIPGIIIMLFNNYIVLDKVLYHTSIVCHALCGVVGLFMVALQIIPFIHEKIRNSNSVKTVLIISVIPIIIALIDFFINDPFNLFKKISFDTILYIIFGIFILIDMIWAANSKDAKKYKFLIVGISIIFILIFLFVFYYPYVK